MKQRAWVRCLQCSTDDFITFCGKDSISQRDGCPVCGSDWKKGKLVACSESIPRWYGLGDFPAQEDPPEKIIWFGNR